MPYSRFCSVHDASLTPFFSDLESMLLQQDSEKWTAFFRQLSSLIPLRRLSRGPGFTGEFMVDSGAPLLEGLSADQVPPANSPRLWVLAQRLMWLTATHFLHGRDDGFNGTFTDWLSRKAQTEAERKQHQLFVETIFLPRQRLSGPLRLLGNPDTIHSYSPLDRLRALLQVEEEVGFLERVARELLASSNGLERVYGDEILRMLRFFQLLEAEKLGLYYWEYST